MLDYNADHYCPVYKKVICADLCYDSLCCLNGEFKISSTKELAVIEDIDEAERFVKTAHTATSAAWTSGCRISNALHLQTQQ